MTLVCNQWPPVHSTWRSLELVHSVRWISWAARHVWLWPVPRVVGYIRRLIPLQLPWICGIRSIQGLGSSLGWDLAPPTAQCTFLSLGAPFMGSCRIRSIQGLWSSLGWDLAPPHALSTFLSLGAPFVGSSSGKKGGWRGGARGQSTIVDLLRRHAYVAVTPRCRHPRIAHVRKCHKVQHRPPKHSLSCAPPPPFPTGASVLATTQSARCVDRKANTSIRSLQARMRNAAVAFEQSKPFAETLPRATPSRQCGHVLS